MHKAVFMLDRGDDVSVEEFREYWEEEHAPVAVEEVPGLRKYTISFPVDAEEAPHDGMATLYFDSEADLEAAMASEAMAELGRDLPNFADPDSAVQLLAEERVQVDRT